MNHAIIILSSSHLSQPSSVFWYPQRGKYLSHNSQECGDFSIYMSHVIITHSYAEQAENSMRVFILMNLTIWFSNFSASCFPFLKNWQWTFTPDNCNCTPRPPCSVAEQTAWHCGNCASIAIVINSFLCLCFFLEISTILRVPGVPWVLCCLLWREDTWSEEFCFVLFSGHL